MPYRDPRIDQDRKVMMVIGARFARARKFMGGTEKDLSLQLGTTEAFIFELERGECMASWATTRRLGRILGFKDGELEQIEIRARREDNEKKPA